MASVWDLDFGRIPAILTNKNGSLSLNYLCKQCGFCWRPVFLLGAWNLAPARKRLPSWPAPSKNSGHWVSNELTGKQHFTCVVTPGCQENQVHPMRVHQERTLGSLGLVPPTLFQALFPFADFTLYLLTVINHNHEYNHKLNPASLLANRWTWKWSWGPSAHSLPPWDFDTVASQIQNVWYSLQDKVGGNPEKMKLGTHLSSLLSSFFLLLSLEGGSHYSPPLYQNLLPKAGKPVNDIRS